MANVDVSVSSKLSPEQAWALASNLKRFDEWLTIFGGWRSPVPEVVEQGTCVSSLIKVKGFRNTIRWEVTDFDAPKRLAMRGSGRGGVHIALNMAITDEQPGTTFHVQAALTGALLNGPVGGLVARIIKSDVEKSVRNLAALN
jgi:Polyketide cyclase / dehydrase and lipid transport